MRHDLLSTPSLAPAPRSSRVREAPGAAGLVAPAGLAQRLASCPAGAHAAAVALTAVAVAADEHLDTAARAGERPGIAQRLALPCASHARPASVASACPDGAAAHGRTRAPAAILRVHSRSTRVGRGGRRQLARRGGRCARSWRKFYRIPAAATSVQRGGLGAQPPVQAFVDHFSQRQRSVCFNPACSRQPDLPRQADGGCAPSRPSPPQLQPHWVHFRERTWVHFHERQSRESAVGEEDERQRQQTATLASARAALNTLRFFQAGPDQMGSARVKTPTNSDHSIT